MVNGLVDNFTRICEVDSFEFLTSGDFLNIKGWDWRVRLRRDFVANEELFLVFVSGEMLNSLEQPNINGCVLFTSRQSV
jgi:hypothetical protein